MITKGQYDALLKTVAVSVGLPEKYILGQGEPRAENETTREFLEYHLKKRNPCPVPCESEENE